MGASVAFEMAASGAFSGPVVLLGISLSLQDEAMFVRVLEARRAELLDDLRTNDPTVMRQLLRGYFQYLGRHDSPAARLCDAGVPAWVVHDERGAGGVTADEQSTLETCPNTLVITVPGTSFFLTNEESERIAELVVEALGRH